MTTTLSPLPVQRFYDNNGNPAVSGKLFTYQAGTTTKLSTYTDSTGSTPNTNPVILNQRGEANVWINPNVAYKYVFAPSTDTDPPTNPFWTVDNIVNSQLVTLYGGVDTGTANNYVLNFTANFTSYTDGIIIYWYPSHTNTSSSTVNINGLGTISIVRSDGSAIQANDIIANQFSALIYKGGFFYLLYLPYLSGSFTGTLTGMTGVVTGTVLYKISNSICTLYVNGGFQGTSNSTAMAMTGLPSVVLPIISSGRLSICYPLVDNSVSATQGVAFINPVSSLITFSLMSVSGTKVQGGGLFTAANNKGLGDNWSVTYPL